MEKIKLIVSDWEGVVTEPGGGRVIWPIEDIARLSKIMDFMRSESKYPPFVLNTGRAPAYVEAGLQAIHAFWNQPSICEHGCIFYYPTTKKFFVHPKVKPIEHKLSIVREKILEIVENAGGERELGKEYCVSVNPPEGKDLEWFYELLLNQLKEFKDIIEVTHSRSAVDITPKGVNKGSALDYLSSLTGIPVENMLGIGDSKGDIKMLERVGVAAAPSNATDKVKAIVDYVSPYPTTKGVIDILFRFVPGLKTAVQASR